MKVRGKITPILAAAAFMLAVAAGPLQAQQTGTVTGVVQDATSGQTLESAQVFISALNMGSLTNAQGRFLLNNVPAGQHELSVELIGYGSATETITVQAGQTTTVQFELSSTALRLQELVVTGVAGETPRVKLPFTVESVDFAEMPVPQASAEGLLQARVPGVRVVRGSGKPGDEASVMLRGPTTITGAQGPLIIVDGVITDNTLADVNSLDVESIEIVKGAAAASLYGSRAQNGVVQIQTKRGAGLDVDQSRITLRNDYGFNDLEGEVELTKHHPFGLAADHGLDDNGGETPFVAVIDGELEARAYGPGISHDGLDGLESNNSRTFIDNDFPGPIYDHVETFFDPGEEMQNYLAIEGKSSNTNYRASFTNYDQAGVITGTDGFTRRNVRLNVDHEVLPSLNVSLNTYYAQSTQDENSNGALFTLTFQAPNINLAEKREDGTVVPVPDPFSLEENPLHLVNNRDREDRRERFMGSVFARWSPLEWFNLEANYSLDRYNFNRTFILPRGFEGVDQVDPGSLHRAANVANDVNASVTAKVNYAFGDLTTRNTFRYLLEDQHSDNFSATGDGFVVGDVPVFDNIRSGDFFNVSSSIQDIVSEGFFYIGALDYQGKYIGDFLVRRDGSSLFGADQRWQTYFRASAAWRMAQEAWWPVDALNEFKLRYSWGQAGGRPRFSNQYETYSVGGGVIQPIQLGNKELTPELTTEQEIGLEWVLFDDWAGGFTYAKSDTDDLLLNVPLPGVAGFSSQWQNAGAMESETYEAWLETSLVQTPDVTWTARVNFDRTEQLITRLDDVPPYRSSSFQYIREGEELGAFYGTRWATSCADVQNVYDIGAAECAAEFDVNDDGYLVWVGAGNTFRDGITGCSDDPGGPGGGCWGTSDPSDTFEWGMPIKSFDEEGNDFLLLGNSSPDFAVSFASTVRWRNFSLSGLLDLEQGQEIYNQTRQWAAREQRNGESDQAGKPDELKKPIQYSDILYSVNATNSHYVEDGSFAKIRELSLRYTVDQSQMERVGFLNRIGVNQATINAIGRNLLTFTDYRGYDPEVGFSDNDGGGSAVVNRADAFQYPNFRTLSFSLELIF